MPIGDSAAYQRQYRAMMTEYQRMRYLEKNRQRYRRKIEAMSPEELRAYRCEQNAKAKVYREEHRKERRQNDGESACGV